MLYQRSSFSRSLLHTAALCALLCAHSHVAQAEPQGGAVTSGSAAISTSGATTTINQSSDRAIIRWDSFDINNAEHVKFLQPSSSSLTVNRIRDTKASTINGKITANGNIILINPNGLIFGASSIVDVGSLVATTSDLEDDHAFMAGGAVKFTKPGNIDAKIITNGNITVREAGLVGLVAPHVENNGIIQARLGKVQLASGDIHTIDFAGDGLIKLEISDAVVSQSVKNTGQIFADGGDILLTASVARHIVNTIVTNTGTLQANTVTMPDGALKIGSITMTTHGLGNEASLPDPALNVTQVVNTGLVFANGNGLNQIGGLITLLADNVLVGDGSYVEAAGDVGGGAIRIGGDYQGGGSLPTSDMIFISEHAILNADTRRRGRGGTIILWSDENTRFYGDASAEGGSEEGNGGLIEVSSKKYLDFNGTVNLKAANGQNGTLLLDPTNITISTGANTDVTGSSPFTPSADNATSILNITTLQAALAAGNVIVQTRATGGQAGTITVANALSWSSGNTLTLDAHDAITVNAAIAAGTGSLTMIAGGDVALNANVTGSGTITIRQASDALTMGLAGGAGTLNLSAADLNRIVDGWSSVVLGRATSTVTLTANARTWADNVTLLSGTGAINLAGTQTIGGNNLTVTSVGGAVTLAGLSGTTGQLSVDSGGGTISISGASATTGAVSLLSGGGNISTSATLGSGALTMTSGGGVITIGGNITATGATNLTSGAGEININAALNAGANALTLSSANANITSNASGAITGGVVNITTGDGNLQTGAALTSSGIMTINTGAGLLSLGAATSSTAAAMNLTTTARAISTAALTSGALSVNSNGANIGIGAITASGNSTITSGIGSISISGAANTGANSLSLSATNNTVTTAAITSGALSMTSGGGAIQTGGIVAANGITNINSGGGAMTLNAAFGSGTGAMTLTTGGGTLTTFSGNLSSAALTITTSGGNVAIGNGGITATGIGSIITGAGTFGSTGAINTGTSALGITTTARTITTAAITAGALTLASGGANIQTGALTISGTSSITSGAATISIGAVTGGANALTLSSTGFGITTAAITSGNLSIASAGGIITAGGAIAAAGTLSINSGAAAMNLNSAVTSTGTMTLTTTGAAITKNGTGAMSSGALNITTANGNISLSPTTLTTTGATTMNAGTGSITVGSTWTATGQTIGLTTTGNTVSLSTVSSAALTINSNGGAVTLGATTTSGILTVNSGAGNVSLNGAVATAANAINITTTGGNISKSANITSTGAITFTSGGGLISIGTGTMGSASTGSVTLNSGGGNITIGGSGISYTTGGAVSMNSGAAGVITINNAIATGTGALTITTDTNIAINAALNGTGALTIQQFSAATGIGIGAAQAGAVNISAAEFALIATTRSSRTFGRVDGTGDINIAGTTTWADPLVLRSSTGVINFNGAQNFGANNLTITTDADILVGGTLTGAAGTMTIAQQTNATTIGLGTGQAGTIAFNNTELGYLTNGWASVIIGSTTATGDMNIGTMTWNDPMTFRSNTGIINVNGVQTMAVNNGLAFNTNSNLNLGANIIGSGTGALTISTIASSATTMGFGDTMVGTLNLTNAELARIVNGWASITLGSTTAAGAINVGAYTWNDALSIASNSGAITARYHDHEHREQRFDDYIDFWRGNLERRIAGHKRKPDDNNK
jgi:filamentous hemagglutinin family protein